MVPLSDTNPHPGGNDPLNPADFLMGGGGGAIGSQIPLLAKEFIIEPYQIFLARAKGADAILLIAAVLPNQDLKYLMKIARQLQMTVRHPPTTAPGAQARRERVISGSGNSQSRATSGPNQERGVQMLN